MQRSTSLVGSVVVAAALALSACGSNSGGSASEDATFHWITARAQSDTTVQAIESIAADYSLEHPEFSLTVEYIADRPSYLQKIKVLAASGELPELFDADPEPYFADIATSGAVADIAALYSELGVEDDFFPISIEYPKFSDGSLNLITWNANAEYFFYNKDAFAQAGAEVPTTLDEVLAVCDTIAAADLVPVSIAGANKWPYYRYLSMPAFRATGNEFLFELAEGEASMLDPIGVESAQYLQQMGERCFQEGHISTDSATALNLTLEGKAALYYTGTWDISSFLDEEGNLLDNIGYFTMPVRGADDVTPATDFYANSGIGTAIRQDAVNDDLKGFLTYLFAEFPDTLLYEFNTLPSIQPEIRDELPEIYESILADISGVGEYARVWDVVLDAATVDTLARETESLTLGLTTPEEYGSAIDQAISQYVGQNQ